jgi:hypothetical protein
MRNNRALFLVFLVIFAALTVTDYLALTDIDHDYISQNALIAYIKTGASQNLPKWTECNLEWAMVQLSIYTRILAVILAIVFLILSRDRANSNIDE